MQSNSSGKNNKLTVKSSGTLPIFFAFLNACKKQQELIFLKSWKSLLCPEEAQDCRKTASLGFSRQFGSGLRAGFADFLRKIDGLRCFFPAHVREKTSMRKSLCAAQTFLISESLLWTEEAFRCLGLGGITICIDFENNPIRNQKRGPAITADWPRSWRSAGDTAPGCGPSCG